MLLLHAPLIISSQPHFQFRLKHDKSILPRCASLRNTANVISAEIPVPSTTIAHRTTVFLLLSVSLLLNVVALLVPFMEVQRALHGKEIYNLTRTVVLLWEHGLHVLAVIVVGFSVVFPFIKLGVLLQLVVAGHPGRVRPARLAAVEELGKWSLIDVFIVCLILALTSDQVFVGAAPRVGLYTFATAILLSMCAGELLAANWRTDAPARRKVHWGYRLLSAVLLAVASCAWLAFMFVPMVAIDDWLLRDRAFTLSTLLFALARQEGGAVTLLLAATLVILPMAEIAAAWALWWRSSRGRVAPRPERLHWLRRWAMLDVFLVALIVFLAEGDALMSLAPHWGAAWLLIMLLANASLYLFAPPLCGGTPRSARSARVT